MRDRIASRYELRERLGTSSTATVWRARDKRRRRDVALKIGNPYGPDATSRHQLATEADAAGRLNHPNIVALLDAHLGRGKAALAFTYIGGETLARRLAAAGRLSPTEAVAIAADVADALAHAHARGVVHRDVKPANVMIGPDGRARLFDFGIAATPQRRDGGLPAPGMTSGTLPYMAPEQLAGQPADPATDVYALGAVLYEMLAGRRPYSAATTDDLARQQRLPAAPVEDAPPEIVELAIAALDFHAHARPRAAVVARRLRTWQAAQAELPTVFAPVVAVAARPTAPPSTRRPSLLPFVAGLLVAIGLVAGSLTLVGGFNARATGPAIAAPPSAVDVPTLARAQPPANPAAGGSHAGGRTQDGNGNHVGNGSRGDKSNRGSDGTSHRHGKER